MTRSTNIAADPCIGSADQIFNRLPEPYQQCWADVLTRISHEPLALGSGPSPLCASRLPATAQ